MDDMQKYLIWLAVAVLIAGGSFFVYKKMHATSVNTIPTDLQNSTAPAAENSTATDQTAPADGIA